MLKVNIGDIIVTSFPTNGMKEEEMVVIENNPHPEYVNMMGEHVRAEDEFGQTYAVPYSAFTLKTKVIKGDEIRPAIDKIRVLTDLDNLRDNLLYPVKSVEEQGVEVFGDDGTPVHVSYNSLEVVTGKDHEDLFVGMGRKISSVDKRLDKLERAFEEFNKIMKQEETA
ncbi:hypothetical protein [Halobacillus litoralis]|uniref:hypothetical protein n=1 Tax=Halobacillus litoralis TaxID=45668 RepID=UPI001CD65CF5|nr:hypothetical protein [Halobacillus litoralis]MCA1021519.1 hypothetical protein [Halobacillus litoralis]